MLALTLALLTVAPAQSHWEVGGRPVPLTDESYGDTLEAHFRATGHADLADEIVALRDRRLPTRQVGPFTTVSAATTPVLLTTSILLIAGGYALYQPDLQKRVGQTLAAAPPPVLIGGAAAVAAALGLAVAGAAGGAAAGSAYLSARDDALLAPALADIVARHNQRVPATASVVLRD